MSLDSWAREYYPVAAKTAAGSDAEALEHSLKKWRGLTPEVLHAHDVRLEELFGVVTVVENGVVTVRGIKIDATSCALCQRHPKDCSKCPLYEVRGIACDRTLEGEKTAPFYMLLDHRDPKPMIEWLELAKVVV